MALTSQTLTFLSIFAFFLLSLCCGTLPYCEPADYDYNTAADTLISLPELFEQSLAESEGVKVASKQLEAIQGKINDFKPVLMKRLEDPNTPKPVKTCLKQCKVNYASAIDGVKASIESIRNQDLAKANVDISAISTDVETCDECFLEIDVEDSEIKAVNDWVRGVTEDCLVNLKNA